MPEKYQRTCNIHNNDKITTKSENKVDGDTENKRVKEYVDVFPECGRMVLFYSADIPHEVCQTCQKDRHACTIWYYDITERKEAVQRAIDAGRGAEVAVAGLEAQTEARTFISELMGKDSEHGNNDPTNGDATVITLELLAELNHKVQTQLSASAIQIISSITGAPSAESFKEGFKLLVPEDLKSIRQLFRRMGLQES